MTADPVLVPKQDRMARRPILMIREFNFRSESELGGLVPPRFSKGSVAVTHDVLRVPHSHVILDCRD